MSETGERDGGETDEGARALKELIDGAFRAPPSDAPVDVLSGVQRKLRERSGGKFYRDAWSTARQPPTLTFLVTGANSGIGRALAEALAVGGGSVILAARSEDRTRPVLEGIRARGPLAEPRARTGPSAVLPRPRSGPRRRRGGRRQRRRARDG